MIWCRTKDLWRFRSPVARHGPTWAEFLRVPAATVLAYDFLTIAQSC